jgi:hypothetical protein
MGAKFQIDTSSAVKVGFMFWFGNVLVVVFVTAAAIVVWAATVAVVGKTSAELMPVRAFTVPVFN